MEKEKPVVTQESAQFRLFNEPQAIFSQQAQPLGQQAAQNANLPKPKQDYVARVAPELAKAVVDVWKATAQPAILASSADPETVASYQKQVQAAVRRVTQGQLTSGESDKLADALSIQLAKKVEDSGVEAARAFEKSGDHENMVAALSTTRQVSQITGTAQQDILQRVAEGLNSVQRADMLRGALQAGFAESAVMLVSLALDRLDGSQLTANLAMTNREFALQIQNNLREFTETQTDKKRKEELNDQLAKIEEHLETNGVMEPTTRGFQKQVDVLDGYLKDSVAINVHLQTALYLHTQGMENVVPRRSVS